MMKRTTIMLPSALKKRAELRARREKKSLGSYIRESLENALRNGNSRASDPLFNTDKLVFADSHPSDMSLNHEEYLLKMLQKEHFHNRRPTRRRKSG